jgi:hypothetical protein
MKAWALLACTFVVVGAASCTVRHADAVSGAAVQQNIDETITPMFRAYDANLRVEPSKCEPVIVEEQGTMGWCDLTVNDVPLKIRVAGAGPPDHFKVDFADASFFEMAKVEKLVEYRLAHHFKTNAVVNCGDPTVRLLPPGTYLTCSVSGSPSVTSIKLKTLAGGNIFTYNPPGFKDTSPIPQALFSLHRQGKTVIVKGSDIEPFISDGMAADPTTRDRSLVVRCPGSMDLTDSKRGVCIVSIPGTSAAQRIGVWIDDAVGLRTLPIDAVIDRQHVQDLAQSDLNRRLRDNGDMPDATVECEKGLLVVKWPNTFSCKATVGGKRYKLVVLVQDFKGTVSWRGIPEP